MENANASNYINLHTQGIGYLSRVREVVVKGRRSSFWSADINMMHGEKGVDQGITYVPFQVNPTNQETVDLLKEYATLSNDKNFSLMVQVRIGDFYPETFTMTKGDKAGQIRTVLKGRLILITGIWVKDKNQPNAGFEQVYERPSAAQEAVQPVEN
jgi:hypothetical protein